MSTEFPTGLDSLTNPGPTDTMDAAGLEHDVQHANLNDAVEAIEAKLGIDGSTDPNFVDYRLAALEGDKGATWGDEFDGASIDAKWAVVHQNNATISQINGCLIMETPNEGFTLLVQPIEGTAWRVETKFYVQCECTDYPYYGLCAYESATDKFTDIVMAWRTNDSRWYVMNHTLTNTTSPAFGEVGAAFYGPEGTLLKKWIGPYYAAIERNGNSIYYEVTNTPGYWKRLSPALTLPGFYTVAPDKVGLVIGGAKTVSRVIFEYIRKVK